MGRIIIGGLVRYNRSNGAKHQSYVWGIAKMRKVNFPSSCFRCQFVIEMKIRFEQFNESMVVFGIRDSGIEPFI